MRDLAFVGFLAALLGMGFRRPFLFVLAYVYVDIVSPQRLCYFMLNSIPISLVCVALAVGGWMIADDKRQLSFAPRQGLLLLILLWAGWTTLHADFPKEALEKWAWVWKALAFAIFLPFTLRTRLRIETMLLFLVLSASSIIIVGGIKTLASGGGYGTLNLMVDSNSGLYEGSTISMVAIAIIPVILWLARFGSVFPKDWRVQLFAGALVFACLLIPIGTETRTGLLCIVLLAVLTLRTVKRRFLYLGIMAAVAAAATPLLPASFTSRMDTIKGYQADSSASTRLAVWAWTWGYVQDHPLGGGFEAYRQNHLKIELTPGAAGTDPTKAAPPAAATIAPPPAPGGAAATTLFDQGRAYHNSYFEMLGEQGFPGLALWLLVQLGGLIRMEVLRRRFADAPPDLAWAAPLATALQHAQLIYLLGSMFVGIAFQPLILMLIGAQIGVDGYLSRVARPVRTSLADAMRSPRRGFATA